ncbi:MAG TPA: DNA polymerase III subunit delta [Candidatus Saccharimonadales bacterium]|nr:DNA polymerase III subunit delta [Candidatus Saccharimonadales bacterium]
MIQTLTGENAYELQRGLNKIVEAFVAKYGSFAIEQLDASEADFGSLQEALTGLPFLTPNKLVVIKQVAKNSDLADKLENLSKLVPDTNTIILIEEKLDKRSSLYKFLKNKTEYIEYGNLDTFQTIKWLEEAAVQRQAKIANPVAKYLVERVGINQERLSNELDKLSLYDKHITRETIDLLTDNNPSSTIFDLLEAAFSGNGKRMIKLYDEQRQLKVEPQQIISMLSWQLHILVLVMSAKNKNSDEIAREAGLNPYVVRKSQTLSRQLSPSRISDLISNLLQIDTDSKSKNIDLDDALTHFLLTI